MAEPPDQPPKASSRSRLGRKQTVVTGALPGQSKRSNAKKKDRKPHPSLDDLVEQVLIDPAVQGDIHRHAIPPRQAVFGQPKEQLHPRLRTKLLQIGLSRLYRHQALALDAALSGKDVVLVTSTSSGKTLGYNLPVIQTCLSEPAVHAMYLYPTKALAHDQLLKLEQVLPGEDLRAGVYDGDTAAATRSFIRRNAQIVLTNPDMLHIGILPQHETWSKFLRRLRFVVIDEMHVYRGIYGSHFGGILRRLLRLCDWYGVRPQIIASSATLANPTDLFTRLTSRSPVVIDEDGAPTGRRTLLLVSPSGRDFSLDAPPEEEPLPKPRPNAVVAHLVARLTTAGARVLAFTRSRTTTEIVLRTARGKLEAMGGKPASIEGYRGGYTPRERRDIENRLRSGKVHSLVSTSAMELGVDIGHLDAVILNGYPGSIASFWQQVGRAGRGTRDALAIFVAHDDPLEQYLVRFPETLLGAPMEAATTNPVNPNILGPQLCCAAYERPIAPSELELFGDSAIGVAEQLEEEGRLAFSGGRFFWTDPSPPAPQFALRGLSSDSVRLVSLGEEIGQMERWRAATEAHSGAVYLHRDRSFVVTDLDLDHGEAVLEERDVDYYTQPILQSSVHPRRELASQNRGEFRASLVQVEASVHLTGFRELSLSGDEPIAHEAAQAEALTFSTVAVRIDLPPLDDASLGHEVAPVHALEHALMAVAPLLAGCESADLGSAWYVVYAETLAPALFVFDRAPGGIGLADRLFEDFSRWLTAARTLLASCPCANGCPACLLSARCESGNQYLDKRGALDLLDRLLGPG
ncbi:MAG TPA: DEAD/DEAH box helicase [Fimbriimonadaceae bacterium]|nr:DEAD/DEAH box helicase [Fimbriimonadaceae bacterium]HRJ95679.1 DEAD/DEAH box helicase [Fimbriimonadaceae bacterium]